MALDQLERNPCLNPYESGRLAGLLRVLVLDLP